MSNNNKWRVRNMPEKKKQHYVPQFYMRLFSDENDRFAVFNIGLKKTIYPVPYNHQCYENYYYGKDGVWENRLSDMEKK